jgi:hypothetical protein
MMVLIAMFIVAVPTAVAQSPVTDQYTTTDDTGVSPTGDEGTVPTDEGGAAPAQESGAAPVEVREVTAGQANKLPFTGGQISLIALIGLGLLAAGTVGIASTRRRSSATAA